MEYLINMGLAGSLMWIFYLLIKLIAKGRFSDSWRYVMLKCVLIYYLIPIPFMKWIYSSVWDHIVSAGQEPQLFALYRDEYRVLYGADRTYLDQTLALQLIIGGFLAGAAAAVFVYKMRKYRKQRKILLRCRNSAATGGQNTVDCKALQEAAGIKRNIIYIDSTPADMGGNTAFTIGIWKPIILYPARRDSKEVKLILEHELQHVKNRDVLWRMLLDIAGILHFYNPFAWFFGLEFESVSEMVCDAGVIRNKDEKECRSYAELLIRMAQDGTQRGMAWSAGISRKTKKIQERVAHVMRKEQRHFKKVVSAILVGGAVFLNSFTAFAYDDVKVWTCQTEDPESFFQEDTLFAEEEAELENVEFLTEYSAGMNILYDTQFMDETGNIYEIGDDAVSVMGLCSTHQYVDGIVAKHRPNSSGGCTVTVYSAKRCSKCGLVVMGEELSVTYVKVCNH